MRLDRAARGKRQLRQQGAEEAEPRAPPQLPKVQDVASLQSLPAPFGPLLAASPSSPSPQCANSQTRDEAQSLTSNSKPPLGARQVTKRRSKTQSSRLTVPVPSPRHHGSPPNPTLLSTDPNNTSQSNTLYWKGIVLRAPSPPLGPRAPIPRLSSDLSIGQLETGHPPPSQSANPPFSLPKLETQPLSPRDASSFQGVQSLPRPASEPLAPASSSRRGSCCATPSPPAHQSRGTRPGQLRSPCLPPSGQKKVGLLRAPRDNVESLGLPPFTPRGSRTSKARGEESRSPPAKPGGRTSRLPRCPEQSGA